MINDASGENEYPRDMLVRDRIFSAIARRMRSLGLDPQGCSTGETRIMGLDVDGVPISITVNVTGRI